jgi:Family of unknown function (DUF5995)
MLVNNTNEVIQYLDTIIAEAKLQNSRRGFFAALYRQVTLKVKMGINNGFFDDASRMEIFTTQFANRYFAALTDYKKNGKTSKSWQVTFNAENNPDLLILQHLLLAINAHINLDLGIVAAEITPGDQLPTLEGDFNKINSILMDLLDPVQLVINQLSPLIDILDKVGGRKDEILVNFSLQKARRSAWNHANILAYQMPHLRNAIIGLLDSKVAFLGRNVANPGRTLDKAIDLIKQAESNDVVEIIDALNSVVNVS